MAQERLSILIDSREQQPLLFPQHRVRVCKLDVGDYSLRGHKKLIAVERKSQTDFLCCLTRKRQKFEEQLARLTKVRYKMVLIESPVSARCAWSRLDTKTRLSILAQLMTQFPNVPFMFCENRMHAAHMLERFLFNAYRAVKFTEETIHAV